MPITIDAVYENGVLKPAGPLPLAERQQVRITIETNSSWVQETYGIIGWKGDADLAERYASDAELDFPPPPGAGMIFADLAAGDHVFVDANILTYHFQPHPTFGPQCSQLLQRIENGELAGFTSAPVLGEAAHRLMTLEASVRFGWPFAGIGNRLRTHPADVQRLTAFRLAVDRILHSKVQVLGVVPNLLSTAASICQSIGLLINDGLIVALMQANNLTNLASNDADFDRVPGLTRYAPQ